MKGVNMSPALRRHLPLEMQGEVVGQEVTGSQSGTLVQRAFTNVQADIKVREVLK